MTDPTPVTDQHALDRFIAANAPAWLKDASVEELDALRESLASHHRHQARVTQLLATLQALDDFAEPRLLDALRSLDGCAANPRTALWRDIRLRVELPVFRVTDVDLPTFRHYPVETDLLSRLLQNFSEDEASAGHYYPGAGIVEGGQRLPCAPWQVAALCRTLDLGGQYQKHLDDVLTPDDDSRRQQVLDLLCDDKRAALAAHAWCSYLKDDIDLAAQSLLLDFAKGSLVPDRLQSWARVSSLQLLGFEVPDTLLLEVAEGGQHWYEQALVGQVLLYLPNDPNRPLRQCRSWILLNDELATDLRYGHYVDFFTRQLQRDDRLSFLGKLRTCLETTRPQLEAKGLACGERPFELLALRQIARIKADAALLLVPTAAIDQALHRQRVEALKSAGLTVAGVLASFIPGVGELMLVGLVKDLLSQVYEGVVDWTHGQHEEALDHLLGVLGNVALTTLVAAGTAVALRELHRSSFVDGLLPVLRDDGGRRLWSAQRASHQVPLALPPGSDADGLVRMQGRYWWRAGEQVVEVRQDPASARWRIVHPSRRGAWAPELDGNGDGAWWQAGEQPLQWQGIGYLLGRLGPRSAGLSTTACEQVAMICGYDEARLRGLLVERRAMPVGLVQVLADFALDTRISTFFEQLASNAPIAELDAQLCRAAPELMSQAPSPTDQAAWWSRAQGLRGELFERMTVSQAEPLDATGVQVQRAFPGLPERFVAALPTAADGARIEAEGRLPLALQERAHQMLREVRVLQALEGLYLASRCRSDSVRMVFSLFRRLPQWPRGLSFELREGAFDGPALERVLPLGEAREVKVLVGDHGLFETFHSSGMALGAGPVDLFRALFDGLDPAQREALGSDSAVALRTLLREQAHSDRERLPGLLGISPRPALFRTPQRLADGRLGYLLSGRGAVGRTTLTGMVRRLYPGFNDLEASVWLDEIQQLDGNPMSELLRGEESLRALDQVLAQWQQEVTVLTRAGRRRVAEEIRRCWCRQTPAVLDVDGRIIGYRLRLERSSGGDLPALPESVDFSHVVDLALSASGQSNRVDGFLQRFPRLRWLDLGLNGCSEVPPALARMPELQELYLDGNHIRLSDACQATLGAMSRLEVLNLDRNPLGNPPDVRQLLRLRRMTLRGTGVVDLPQGLESRPFLELADLRGNQLTELPERFFTAAARIRSATVLFGNPLRPQVRERLWQAGVADGLLAGGPDIDGAREQWLAGMHDDLLRERATQWLSLRAEPGSEAFFTLLNNLLETAEYRLTPGHLQERVWQMIGAAVESTGLRESLFELASAPTTCVDSVASSFSVLDVRLQVSQAAARVPAGEEGPALLAFGRRLFRLDRLEQHARRIIEQRRLLRDEVDEVEVSLAFRVRLADVLKLPGQPRHMQFGDVAAISDTDLAHARQVVETAEAGPELAQFLARQDFWIGHLRDVHGADFRRVEARFWDSLERLCEQQAQLPEGDYLQRMNQLGSDRQNALDELARSFTEKAINT